MEPVPPPAGPVPWRTAAGFLAPVGRGGLVLAGLLTLAQAFVPLLGLLALMYWIDAVAVGRRAATADAELLTTVTRATVLAALVAVLGNVLRSIASVRLEALQRRLADHWLERVQAHAARVDAAAFDEPTFHDQLQRAGGEAGQRPIRLLQDGLALLAAAAALLATGVLLASVAAWLPWCVALTAVPLALGRHRQAQRRLRWQDAQLADQRDVGRFGAVLTSRAVAKDLRLRGLAPWFEAQAAACRERLRSSLQQVARLGARDELLAQTAAGVGLFGAYWVLAREALAGELGLGALVLHVQVAQRIQNGVRDALAALAGVREHRAFLAPLVGFLQWPLRLEVPSANSPATPPPAAGRGMALRGVDVSLRYGAATRTALHALTFSIAAGERCLVTGPNGAGKSSLLKLLARLYEPTTGTLWVDEVPLAQVPILTHRQRLIAVLQDSALFEVTLRENLILGLTAPPEDAALWRALSLLGMADAVRALPLGLDTPCSRRLTGGVEWSAGQARRLVLTRAFATRVDLLLLDEPCAALDADGVTALVAALAALPRTTTVVVVEHHPAVRAVVDRVWTLVAGQLRDAANDRTPPPGELPR